MVIIGISVIKFHTGPFVKCTSMFLLGRFTQVLFPNITPVRYLLLLVKVILKILLNLQSNFELSQISTYRRIMTVPQGRSSLILY